MSDASRIGNSTEAMLPTPGGAAGGMPSLPRHGLTAPGTRGARLPSSGVGEIADDEAQVGLAGMLISQASTGSDVRFEKVAALRRKIESGRYGVAAEDVAEKLIDEMQKK